MPGCCPRGRLLALSLTHLGDVARAHKDYMGLARKAATRQCPPGLGRHALSSRCRVLLAPAALPS